MNKQAPLLMGILNVTPDSFSDGGTYYVKGAALAHAEKLVAEGAHIIDVGGESTRPNSAPVSLQEEMDRVLPVIEAIRHTVDVRLSVDTRKFEIAREAVRLGASVINDVSGGADIRLPSLGKGNDVSFLLMHMQGVPQNMQDSPAYPGGVVADVKKFLTQRVRAFGENGISPDRIWVDPGIGFGKNLDQNLQLLSSVKEFSGLGGRVAIGTSRKSFLGRILTGTDNSAQISIEEREAGTLASNLWAFTQGVSVFRVHDIGGMRRALKTWEAIVDVGQSRN